MKEEEAIELHIEENLHRIGVIEEFLRTNSDASDKVCKKNILILTKINGALQEIQQYRAIGTVRECREAMERQSAKGRAANNQPPIGGWVLCSETLPEEGKFYIVTYRFEDETILKCHELYYGTADGETEPGWYLDDFCEELYKPFEVIAWQMLPKPFEGF